MLRNPTLEQSRLFRTDLVNVQKRTEKDRMFDNVEQVRWGLWSVLVRTVRR